MRDICSVGVSGGKENWWREMIVELVEKRRRTLLSAVRRRYADLMEAVSSTPLQNIQGV